MVLPELRSASHRMATSRSVPYFAHRSLGLAAVQPFRKATEYSWKQPLLDQRRQHLALAIRHVGAREVLADGGLGDAAAFDDAAFFVASQCFVG